MKTISSETINYLNQIYSETQNGVRLTTAIQKFISGPFPIIVRDNHLTKLKEFVDEGKFSTRLGTRGEERNELDFTLPASPKKLFIYDPNDVLLIGLLNACADSLANDPGRFPSKYNLEIDEYTQILYKAKENLPVTATQNDIRKHVYDNYLYKYDNSYSGNSILGRALLWAIKARIDSWIATKNRILDSSNLNLSEKEILIKIEESYLSETNEYTSEASRPEASTGLYDFISKISFAKSDNPYNTKNRTDFLYSNLLNKVFDGSVPKEDSSQRRHFTNVFKGSSIEMASTLTEKSFAALIIKVEESGLLRLARQASTVAAFAKERLSSVEQAKRSALDSIKPERDLVWLTELNTVVQRLSRDPMVLATINVYFPSLVTFFFDTLAAAADYSGNGAGGGQEDTVNSLEDFMDSLEKAFGRTVDFQGKNIKGKIFQLAARYENTAKKMKAVLDSSPYRPNIQPRSPDIFHLRLGGCNFYVPPLSIDVNTFFKSGSMTGGALRQKSSPKFNSGHKETSIKMKLFFPNYEEIWGISIDDASKISLNDNYEIDFGFDGSNEEKIDKFLSSLRGLVAAFKYSPFLPIRNDYLNRVHGITAVALSGMSITTIPNFPFALAVDIELMNFNHKPLLPMINDFNQAVHWGRYRQFMGKAAGQMHSYVNSSFLMKTSDNKESAGVKEASIVQDDSYKDEKLITNIVAEWMDGRNISFYVPAETQTKIYLPDTSSFRSEKEKAFSEYGKESWKGLLGNLGIWMDKPSDYGMDLSDVYELSRNKSYNPTIYSRIRIAIDLLTSGLSGKTDAEKIYSKVAIQFISENELNEEEKKYIKDYSLSIAPPTLVEKNYTYKDQSIGGKLNNKPYENRIKLSVAKGYLRRISQNVESYLDDVVERTTKEQAKKLGIKEGTKQYNNIKKNVKEEVKKSFNVVCYNDFFQNASIEQLMEAARQREGVFTFREWEVPMIKIDLDPKSAIVTGVSLTLGNNIAKMHIQMQDEPTYQHIGGRDTFINISMRVLGESELNKLKRIFDHVNALARLEHSTGVLGFIGIKNIITALAGVKYVIPSNYSVNTVPGYPHVYDVNISLLDFDIFQQGREKLSSEHQKQLIEEFGTKRNPFLRIKQMWGIFNAYPDLPLDVRDKDNKVVGHLDPDFYFRSFEMFDKDVINSFSGKPKELLIPGNNQGIGKQTLDILNNTVAAEIIKLVRSYESDLSKNKAEKEIIERTINLIEINNISYDSFMKLLSSILRNPNLYSSNATDNNVYNIIRKNKKLITDSIEYKDLVKVADENVTYSNRISNNPYQVGNYSTSQDLILSKVQSALSGAFSLKGEEKVSFQLDDLDFVANLHTMPIIDPSDKTKIPAMLSIGSEVHLGYVDMEKDGRFYLTVDGVNVRKSEKSAKLTGPKISDDFSNPAKAVTKNAIAGLQSMNNYGNPYTGNIEAHWEKILIDAQYRDVSGRMLRAFPTYMLWLIDEGGHFAGVKVFDNFYGLQSIIDFSVVSSEDLLGDTLIIRLSNLYSKLTRKESTSIFDVSDKAETGDPSITDGLSRIIDRTLNKARYVLAHIKNDYIVDVENISLKPGVRVHLRGGYGSNPNSLQTLFNGTITQVEQGEIVTVTAQSDAIELGAMVNSTNKKGDSGKIDGGINTGLWLSEPRDLMVRLLSMGASRFRESVAYAQRGLIFSENKFGIRHFGNILYQPMSVAEEKKHYARIDAIADAYTAVGNFNFKDPSLRPNGISLMNQLWSNFSGQRDLEIFKRNIYPGNGTGIAQFLGGDLGDGWTSVSSITSDEQPNERINYLSRLTDRSWNQLVAKAGQAKSTDAKAVIESLTASGKINEGGQSSTAATKTLALGSVSAIVAAPFAPAALVTVGVGAGFGLLGGLSGRGGTNFARMLGLVSANDDDDMPGFDEVSFRAQTYMRSIWDLFKVCARLLPNYIVAVRPFEDRSTIFYGKPHWLYTSGVVPITTGMPTEERMAALGLSSGPKYIGEDEGLQEIIDKIAKETSPYADQEAFLRSNEPVEKILELANIQKGSETYFGAAGALQGKLINFDSIRSQEVYVVDTKTKTNKLKARLPKKKGNVTIGFHLPIESGELHNQINQLPTRFRFPFFVYGGIQKSYDGDINFSRELIDYSFQYSQPSSNTNQAVNMLSELGFLARIFSVASLPSFPLIGNLLGKALQSGAQKTEGNYRILNYYRSLAVSYGPEFVQTLFEVDIPRYEQLKLSGTQMLNPLENVYNFYSGEQESEKDSKAHMPFPTKLYGLNLQEWGKPQRPIDEQFYIAMRWPYIPSVSEAEKSKFLNKYFSEMSKNDLVGTAKDYKNCNVLVYNPSNNIAVVCRPAYFLWDENKTTTFHNNYSESLSSETVSSSNQKEEKELEWSAGHEIQIDAVVSPDAGYFLGIMSDESSLFSSSNNQINIGPGYSDTPIPRSCYFAFVPSDVPLGVATTVFNPIKKFKAKNNQGAELEDYIIGFGNFEGEELVAQPAQQDDALHRKYRTQIGSDPKNSLNEYVANATLVDYNFKLGGNYNSYYQRALRPLDVQLKDSEGNAIDPVGKQIGIDLLDQNGAQSGDINTGEFNSEFTPVFSIADPISIEARRYYEENYDLGVSVIAGTGRSLEAAQEIWNQFRAAYHTYESVKNVFLETYGLNPEDDEEFPPQIKAILTSSQPSGEIFKRFESTMSSANDEFSVLFGNQISGETSMAIEFARRNFIDASSNNNGLIAYFNNLVASKINEFKMNFLMTNSSTIRDAANIPSNEIEFIKTPRQLFLALVGLFRQKMWDDPYSRAWLVLKPSRKIGIGFGAWGDQWDFKSVDKIFAAFISPYATYSRPDREKEFIKLLYKNKSQGSDAGNIFSKTIKSVDNYWDRTIGPLLTAVGAGLDGLLSMFKLNMMQTGYGLSEVASLSKQANILNKSLNDSIYYSLGREGSLLRAVDNPFTREYGEPVVEIREPFQRMHYISSFSHILSNQIMQTNQNVSTVITAVSDGRFPVTVALDKGAPADRQLESTVETGIYFDNPVGEGFFGILHPFLHPFEASRGNMKNLTGSPDELLAKRIGLAHLKENIKDIYGGELLVMGNSDIRPHDLVYLADVYERMYGIFEVEQVIHHFTSELGFVTSITPNALVTVNDPAKWFMTSWIHSWMNTQAIRNDTRIYIGSLNANNAGISFGGTISLDKLSDNLDSQMMGGIQYTHGASAVIKDTVAAMTYGVFEKNPSFSEAIRKQATINGNNGQIGATAAVMLGVSQAVPIFGNLIWKGWTWVRDNLLDQHGAYVQYLNKNGQPMDSGLSYNQGMVVGRYHSKALLPGILGIRNQTRTADGHAYIRTDDLMKNLGWTEVQIKELVRYISYENALVHAKVLDLSGLGPEKTGFEPFFKVLCKLDQKEGLSLDRVSSSGIASTGKKSGVIDGDTIAVTDILSGQSLKIRLDGINAPEKSQISVRIPFDDKTGSTQATPKHVDIIPVQSPGFAATSFVYNALKNKTFLLRIKQNAEGNMSAELDQKEYDPGSEKNTDRKLDSPYIKDKFNRTLATIFYKTSEETLEKIKSYVTSLFMKHNYVISDIEREFKDSISRESFLSVPQNYSKIYNSLTTVQDHTAGLTNPAISSMSGPSKKVYSILVEIKIIEELYWASSKWPLVLWDEYYSDGTPYTLNWELVVNNLANVFLNDVVSKEGHAVITAKETAALPTKVPLKGK